jgi:hypothetical protein
MKKIILSVLLITGLFSIKANAQMAAAQKVNWDSAKDVTLTMLTDDVWEIFNTPEQLVKASNGYVTSVTIKDANFPVVREITFADGTKRTETIKQLERHNKIIVIQLDKVTLPKGVNEAEIAIFIKGNDDKSTITWRALVKGNKEAKTALVEKLNAEFDSYILGFQKMTKKAIPAARMN